MKNNSTSNPSPPATENFTLTLFHSFLKYSLLEEVINQLKSREGLTLTLEFYTTTSWNKSLSQDEHKLFFSGSTSDVKKINELIESRKFFPVIDKLI